MLLPLIDPYFWAESETDKSNFTPANREIWLEAFYTGGDCCFPRKITKTPLDNHFTRKTIAYYASNRASGYALLRFDLDAHNGEDDLEERLVAVHRFFPRTYWEFSPSGRGIAVFVLMHAGLYKRSNFNGLVDRMSKALGCEIQGRFHLRPYLDRDTGEVIGHYEAVPFGALPLLRSDADVERFLMSPIFTVQHAYRLLETIQKETLPEEEIILPTDQNLYTLEGCVSWDSQPRKRANKRTPIAPDEKDAFQRMNWIAYNYTLEHRTLPDLRQLLDAYAQQFGGVEDEERIHRAESILKLRSKKFDAEKMDEGGYESSKSSLMAMVSRITDRKVKYASPITDEDLSLALFLFTRTAFSKHADARRQYTIGTKSICDFFHAMKQQGVTTKGCNRNKATAMKQILERARLIECYDEEVVSSGKNGISQKYVLGPNHDMYQQWLSHHQTVKVIKVCELKKNDINEGCVSQVLQEAA